MYTVYPISPVGFVHLLFLQLIDAVSERNHLEKSKKGWNLFEAESS